MKKQGRYLGTILASVGAIGLIALGALGCPVNNEPQTSSEQGTSPGVTIEAEGYVIDALGMESQEYTIHEDGTITIIYR